MLPLDESNGSSLSDYRYVCMKIDGADITFPFLPTGSTTSEMRRRKEVVKINYNIELAQDELNNAIYTSYENGGRLTKKCRQAKFS